jgi:TRAP-type C4-dicarboxylate transport system permease small subunit
METFFILLAVAGYIGFLIDWKELRDVLKLGGWAALAFYCLIGVLIFAAWWRRRWRRCTTKTAPSFVR